MQGAEVSFLSSMALAGGAAAVPPPMLPAAAGPSALPVDSYTSSYGTNAGGGGLGAAPLMYPSFQLPGAKPEGEGHGLMELLWLQPYLLCIGPVSA